MAELTFSLPQLLILLLLLALTIRWLFLPSSRPPPTPAPSTASRASAGAAGTPTRARDADIEHIEQMFPQLDRRVIMWDLQRNGGSVAATTERVLTGRGLDTPPRSFQPLNLARPQASPATSSAPSSASSHPDLITRYRLEGKVAAGAGSAAEPVENGRRPKLPWAASKDERQKLLQRRREEMILEARRKMQAKLEGS
ncbi:MAG: hypothetical protein M1829_002043 [Trizodia sp. TS-e1964]|nr:MAG: hypothetical protein M1829_002043 [Trizodia sp. TS-e1964]